MGPLGGHLGPILGPSWPPGALLGASLGPPSAFLGHLGAMLATTFRSHISFHPSSLDLGPFWGPLGSILERLGANFRPSWAYLGAFRTPRTLQKCRFSLGIFSAFYRFRFIFSSLGSREAVLARSWAILAPSWAVLASSWGVLAPSWAPKTLPKIDPRGLQDASQNEVQHRPQLKTVRGPLLVEILEWNAREKTCLVK